MVKHLLLFVFERAINYIQSFGVIAVIELGLHVARFCTFIPKIKQFFIGNRSFHMYYCVWITTVDTSI